MDANIFITMATTNLEIGKAKAPSTIETIKGWSYSVFCTEMVLHDKYWKRCHSPRHGDKVPSVGSVGDIKVLDKNGRHRVRRLYLYRSISNRIRSSSDSLDLKWFHELRATSEATDEDHDRIRDVSAGTVKPLPPSETMLER